MNKIIPFYIDFNLKSLYYDSIKYRKKEECYRSKIKFINKNNSLQDILIQTDTVLLKDIIINENNEYYLKVGILSNQLYEFLFNLENIIKETVYNKSDEWFNIPSSKNIKEIYKTLFDSPLKLGETPCFNIKIPIANGCIKSKFFNPKGELISIKELCSNQKIKLILKVNSIKLYESNYLLDIYLYQLQLEKTEENEIQLNHVFEDSDEDIILTDSDSKILSIK
jgi:hypothetical protein